MKLAIMQPYLFPYLGYFQLIHAVDTFVIYDDVSFIKGGWINRNYILARGSRQLITVPLDGASPNKLINEILVGNKRKKILKTIMQSYSKAPQFSDVFPVIENILMQKENNLARFLEYGLTRICNHLGLHPRWCLSAELETTTTLRGQDKVLAICEGLRATHYINLPGGKDLYDRERFARRGLQLSIIQPHSVEYRQLCKTFVPNLSIIDVMMFNDQDQCTKLLREYDLV